MKIKKHLIILFAIIFTSPVLILGQNENSLPDMGPRTETFSAIEKGEDMPLLSPDGVTDLPSDPQHLMYGLNLFIPAFDTTYATNLDWYGSGDINNDGVINMTDYNSTTTGPDPFNDGTNRGDTDLDGDSGDADDKAIIMDYINGDITHINKWELESETEKQSHLDAVLSIMPPGTGLDCWKASDRFFVYTNGVYDISNSGLDFATIDTTKNGLFRIPGRLMNTKTNSGVSHQINSIYMGDPYNQDATAFSDRKFVEPQTNLIILPGNYSMNEDEYAKEKWYGYWNHPVWGWNHAIQDLIDYDLTNGNATITYVHPDLVQSWTPFDEVTYPEDQTHEFPGDTTVSANGEPGNLYPGTVYSHTDVSTQTNDTTCTDVTYTVTRGWEGVAGAYDSTNTPAAAHDQNIDVEDTTPPTADFPENIELEYYVGIEDTLNASLFSPPTNIQDNSALPVDSTMTENSTQVMDGSCSQVNFVYSHNWDINDVCQNNLSHSIEAYVSDNTAPVRDDDGNWSDNSGLEVLVTNDTVSTQGNDPENCDFYNYTITVTENAEDVCGNQASYEHDSEQVTNEAPYIVSTPVPNNDTIYVPLGGDIHPDSTGWAEWADPENGPITKDYEDELVEEDDIHRLYYRTQTATDPCEMSPDSAYHYIYEHKPTGIEEKAKVDNASIYPNPNSGDFNLHYAKQGDIKVGIYNISGQLLEEKVYENLPAGTNILYSMQNKAKGLYIMKIQDEDGTLEFLKIIKNKN